MVTLFRVPTVCITLSLRARMIDYMIGKLLKMGVHISMIIIAIFTIPTARSPRTSDAGAWYVSSSSGRVDFSADFSRVDYSYGCTLSLRS